MTPLYTNFEEVHEDLDKYMRNRFRLENPSVYLDSYQQVGEYDKASRRGKILLGYFDAEYSTEPYFLEYNGSRITILISGGTAGGGKSVLGGNVVLDGFDEFDVSRCFIDPKHEISHRKNPANEFRHRLLQLRDHPLNPMSHDNMVTVTPNIIGNVATDLKTYYTNKDLNRFDLMTMLKIDESTSEGAKQANQLDGMLYGNEFIEALKAGNIKEIQKKGGMTNIPIGLFELYNRALASDGVRIERSLRSLLSQQAIMDEQWSIQNNLYNVNLVELMNQGKVIVYQTSDEQNQQSILSAYVGFELRRIINARENQFKDRKGLKLHRPVILYFGEFQHYFPRHGFSSSIEPIRLIYDVHRYTGLSVVGDTPNLAEVHPTAIRQSDYILCFKPFRCDNVLKERGLDVNQIYEMRDRMHYDKDHHPNQVAVLPTSLDTSDSIMDKVIYPIPPRSSPQKEQRVLLK